MVRKRKIISKILGASDVYFFYFLSNLLKANAVYTVSLCSHEEKL